MKNQKFSFKKRLKSFSYAWNGLKILLKEEHNARIHICIAIIVLIAACLLKLSKYEWMAIVFAIGFVISMELINSSIESMADFISPEKHISIKKIKDLAAAAVLISAISSALIGFIIFIPKMVDCINTCLQS